MDFEEAKSLRRYRRAADYLACAQIYLRDNVLLDEPLALEHIKPRLVGHWGTVPGIDLVHAHLNRIIRRTRRSVLLVTGPGHGAPASLANLFLEGSLEARYPELTRDRAGMQRLAKSFSWPGGFPSHLTPMVPGVIHEGGELGYALAKSFGAALDRPNDLVACIVGDGEAETGPTATAWHGTKFLDPVRDGAVLPILHLNGFKISSPTIFSTMNEGEIRAFFTGYGWAPIFVAGGDDAIDEKLADAMDIAVRNIDRIQGAARAGHRRERPAWPMIVLETPKGLGCPKTWNGKPLEGTWRTHQVPITDAQCDWRALKAVEEWLLSYVPSELFDDDGRPAPDILATCPEGDRRIGMNPLANAGAPELPLPSIARFATKTHRGARLGSIHPTGEWLRDLLRATEDTRSFRIVSPDELTSNKLEPVLEATHRTYEWPTSPLAEHIEAGGRVMETLSEHTCQGWLEGYVLTGRSGLFPCYEAFISIVDGMMNQYAKLLKQKRQVPWRKPVASLNYLLTSDGWRQDHNGYSHQGPGFINAILDKKGEHARVYLPADANTLLVTMEHAMRTRDTINLIIATKNEMPQWLSLEEAREALAAGASRWAWASSDDPSSEPDVVLACAGATPTQEALAAVELLRKEMPDVRLRLVNVIDLFAIDSTRQSPHAMDDGTFATIFGRECPVIFAFHGYPSAVHALLFKRPNAHRFTVHGYEEEGTTTTPFDMVVRNRISRHHLAMDVIRAMDGDVELVLRHEEALAAHRTQIRENGKDPAEISEWTWTASSR